MIGSGASHGLNLDGNYLLSNQSDGPPGSVRKSARGIKVPQGMPSIWLKDRKTPPNKNNEKGKQTNKINNKILKEEEEEEEGKHKSLGEANRQNVKLA